VKFLAPFLALFIAGVAVPALAQKRAAATLQSVEERGAYVGGMFGKSKFKDWCNTSGAPAGFQLLACDDSDTAAKIFGGWRFNRFFALEASYIDWGEVSGTVSTGGAPSGVASEQQSMGLAAVGNLPLTQNISVFGKLGRLRTEQEIRSPASRSVTESEWHYGLGFRYAATRNLAVRGEWERTEKLEVSMLSLGVEYSFAPILIPPSVSYSGLYVGGALGQMEVSEDCPTGFSCDLKDIGWKVFGGYRAHRNLAVEVTYANWGEISLSTSAARGTGAVKSWGVAALGLVGAGERISLFAKGGVVVTQLEICAAGAAIQSRDCEDGGEFHWGLGALFSVKPNVALRAEWERLQKSELDFLSLGVQYRF
jgi:OmpA-OmpF porin, OOP family